MHDLNLDVPRDWSRLDFAKHCIYYLVGSRVPMACAGGSCAPRSQAAGFTVSSERDFVLSVVTCSRGVELIILRLPTQSRGTGRGRHAIRRAGPTEEASRLRHAAADPAAGPAPDEDVRSAGVAGARWGSAAPASPDSVSGAHPGREAARATGLARRGRQASTTSPHLRSVARWGDVFFRRTVERAEQGKMADQGLVSRYRQRDSRTR